MADRRHVEGVANDGDAGGASDDAKRVSERVRLDPNRLPVVQPQRRRSRRHVGCYGASALFDDPFRRTKRALRGVVEPDPFDSVCSYALLCAPHT